MNPDDPRLGQHIADISKLFSTESTQNEHFDLTIVGMPWDEGVRRNGGRLGAHLGPEHFRQRLARMGTMINMELDVDLNEIRVGDLGDVTTQPEEEARDTFSLEQAHDELSRRVAFAIDKLHAVPFVIGGGNDQSYPNVLPLLRSAGAERVGAINVDAHLDVRPLKEGKHHSGSPFRRLLEHEGFKGHNFVEFASQGSQCSAEHVRFITEQHGGRVLWLRDVLQRGAASTLKQVLDEMPADSIFFSFDLDAVRASDAPGVSAPGSIGLSSDDALEMCLIAGRHPKVKLMDLSEYNPIVESYVTGRLVANMFIYFACGLVLRTRDQLKERK